MLYFYPNKPILIQPTDLLVGEKSRDPLWWAEIKKNGTRLALRNDKNEASQLHSYDGFVFMNGDKEVLKYEPSPEVREELNSFKIPLSTHIDAELLHQKTKNIKHLIYIYDIYWYKGVQVLEPLSVRRRMIEDIFGDTLTRTYKHFELAKVYPDNFEELFKLVIVQSENEGLVLKDRRGLIVWNLKKRLEVAWQLKIRKPSESYRF